MTIYFQGSELEALFPNPAYGSYTEDSSGEIQTAWSRAGSQVGGSDGAHVLADAGTELSEFWGHYYHETEELGPQNLGDTILSLYNGSGVKMVRIYLTSSSTGQLQYLSGAAWVNVGAVFSWATGIERACDVRVKIGDGVTTPDIVEFYIDELAVASVSTINILRASFTGVRSMTIDHRTRTFVVSQVIISDTSTIDWHSKTVPPTTLGTDTDGVGVVGDVNESPISNATYISFSAAAEKAGFKGAARTLTQVVKAVTVTGRLRVVDETGPQSIKPYLLINSTYYYGTTFALSNGYENYQYTWNVNPDTGIAWTTTDANSADLEWGWEAVA